MVAGDIEKRACGEELLEEFGGLAEKFVDGFLVIGSFACGFLACGFLASGFFAGGFFAGGFFAVRGWLGAGSAWRFPGISSGSVLHRGFYVWTAFGRRTFVGGTLAVITFGGRTSYGIILSRSGDYG